VPIGNSKGIRIPRSVIKQCGFGDHVEMSVSDGVVKLTQTREAREDWDAAFKAMGAADDDVLLLPDGMTHRWDGEEWVW